MFVTLAALPEWLDAERLQWASWGLTGLLVIVGLLVVRFVQRLLTVVLSLALVGGLVVGLWIQRDDLRACQATCSCSLFGQDVTVPARLPCGPDGTAQDG